MEQASLWRFFLKQPEDILIVSISAIVGAVATAAGQSSLGPEMCAFVAGVSVGALSNMSARVFKRPVSLFLLPGIILSVPGSIGLRSAQAFILGKDAITGIGEATVVVSIAISLVAGLLVGNNLINPRRHL